MLSCFESVVVAAVFVILGVLWVCRRRGPRGFRPVDTSLYTPSTRGRPNNDLCRDGFASKKVPQDLDAIVVGSGIGGLTAAAALAKVGKKVLVLEQHYVAGGCTHVFEEDGFAFDSGVHYVGQPKAFDFVLNKLTYGDKLEWHRLGSEDDGFVYDVSCIGKEEDVPFVSGRREFIHTLCKHFPTEADRASIERYVDAVRHCSRLTPVVLMTRLVPSCLVPLFGVVRDILLRVLPAGRYARMSSWQAVKELCPHNPRLAVTLLTQCGDYGLNVEQAPFVMHAAVAKHYLYGAYFPVGGSHRIAECLIPTIECAGGRVLVRAPVESIIVKGGKACGVRVRRGGALKEITAKCVISDAGAQNTWLKLLPKECVSELNLDPRSVLGSITPGACHVQVFMGLEGSPSELNLPSNNYWVHQVEGPDYDFTKFSEEIRSSGWDPSQKSPTLAFISFPCTKDPQWDTRHPDKSVAIIITECNADLFQSWEEEKSGSRSVEYNTKKEDFKETLLEVFFDRFPQLRSKLRHVSVGSPATSQHYIGCYAGESYGIGVDLKRLFDADCNRLLSPKTPVPGLYLTGQDVLIPGVMGAMTAGVFAAQSCLGYGLVDLMSNRGLLKDIGHLRTTSSNAKED